MRFCHQELTPTVRRRRRGSLNEFLYLRTWDWVWIIQSLRSPPRVARHNIIRRSTKITNNLQLLETRYSQSELNFFLRI